MKLSKRVMTGLLSFSLFSGILSGMNGGNENMIYAQSSEVIYRAFSDNYEFSDRYYNLQWGLNNDGTLQYSEQVGGRLTKQPVTQVTAVNNMDIDMPEARAKYS